MSTNSVELRIVATGAEQAARVLQGVADAGAQVGKVTTAGANQAATALNGFSAGLKNVQGAAQNVSTAMATAGLQTGIFGQALTGLVSPASAVAVALGSIAAAAVAGVRAMSANADEVRRLVAVSGLSEEAADNLADTFQLLGRDTATLNAALFRMATVIDDGGKALTKIGVSAVNSSGFLKTEGDLFLEVRDRLSEMTSATERNAAAQAIFGRGARELTDIFSLTRDEFRKVAEQAGSYSEWNGTLQRQTVEYQRALSALSLQFDALAQMIGRTVIPPLTEFLKYITDTIEKSKTPIEFIIRVTFGGAAGDIAAGFLKGLKEGVDDPLRQWLADTLAGVKVHGKEISEALRAGMTHGGASGGWDEMKAGVRPGPSDEDVKRTNDAAAALRGFQRELAAAAIGSDATAQALAALRAKVSDLIEKYPQLAAQFQAIGVAQEAIIVRARQEADALKELGEQWKDTLDPASSGAMPAALSLGTFDTALSTTGDLVAKFAKDNDTLTLSLDGTTKAVVTFTEAFPLLQKNVDAVDELFEGMIRTFDNTLGVWAPTNEEIRKTRAAAAEAADALRMVDVQAKILGSDFDAMGARVSIARESWERSVRAFSEGKITLDELSVSGLRFRETLADASLFQGIQDGFLSITDTFTKMADGLIQGTLEIGDAFANLGKNLLANFVQVVLHQVFDPILKEAASFVSGLIGLLTGRGGLVSGAGGAAAIGLVGGLGSAFGFGNNFSTEQVAAIMQGGAAAGGTGAGGDTLGTLSGVASGLSTLYGVVAKIAGLPSLLDLTATGLTSVGAALGILGPSLTAAEVSAIGLAAAAGGAAGGAGAGVAAAGAGAFAGGVGAGLSALAGPAALLGIPLLAGFLDTLGKAEIARENIERRRAQAGFDVNLQSRLAAAEAGVLSPADIDTFHKDIGIMLQSAKFNAGLTAGRTPDELEGPAFNMTNTAQAFVKAAEAAGYMPVPEIDLGRGPMSTLAQADFDLLQRYTDLLAKGVESWGKAAEAAQAFDVEGVMAEVMADLPRIALLLDLPSLQREGEDVADTFQRMVAALVGLETMMERLAFDAQALRGDLNVADVLASNLKKVTEAMDAANIAMATTRDPEQILAAAEQRETLIRQSFEMIFDSIAALVGKLRGEAESAASGFVALAQAAPVLRELGIEVGGMTAGLADVVELLGEVGDAAGQLAILRGAVAAFGAEVAGANPASILASAQAFTRSLAATAQGVNALTDAQQRMAGLTEILGDLTQGYEAATAALTAHFDALRQEEAELFESRRSELQDEIDQSIRLVENYYASQRTALAELSAASREWAASATRIRDQVSELALGPGGLSPLNPADQLSGLRQEFATALSGFWQEPSAELADTISGLGARVLESGAQVFSRPSPAFAELSAGITSALDAVAGAAEARVTPESVLQDIATQIDTLERETLDTLGVVTDANEGILATVGGLTLTDAATQTALGTVVSEGVAAKEALDALTATYDAKLAAIDAEQAGVEEELRAAFGTVAATTLGTATAVYQIGWDLGLAIASAHTTLGGIWGTLGSLYMVLDTTKTDLNRLLGDIAKIDPTIDVSSINMAIEGLKTAQGIALEALGTDVEDALRDLVEARLNTLIDHGGTQAVVDALATDGPVANAVRASGQNIYYAIRDLSRHLGLQGENPPRVSFAEGTFGAPGGPALLHRGEVVAPVGVSAADWVRGMAARAVPMGTVSIGPGTGGGGRHDVTVNQTFQDARDPETTAELAARRVIRVLKVNGII